jgi:SAM-dependent methyltransferase
VTCALWLTAAAVSLVARQQPPETPAPYEPTLGQKGKDVQWVPTPPALIEKMLDLAKLTPDDYLVDLGSGDGVTVIAAARRGARALGIEYDPRLVELSRRNAAAAHVSGRTRFVHGDIFKTDFSSATVVTTFLLPSLNLQLRPTILAMKPGTRVVSNTFPMGEWEPDETASITPCERWCQALLWIVPARVGGTWRSSMGMLELTQRFQIVSGTLDSQPIGEGRLRGTEFAFTANGIRYTAQVDGYRMRGSYDDHGRAVEWNAQYRPPPGERPH